MFFNHSFVARRKKDYAYLKSVSEKKKERETMAIDFEVLKLAQAHAAQAKLAQAQASQKYINAAGGISGFNIVSPGVGSGAYGGYINQGIVPLPYNGPNGTIGIPTTPFSGQTPVSTPVVPMPSGIIITIQFYDAHGNMQTITVDSSYASIMNDMSARHLYAVSMKPHTMRPATKPIMDEGEFSLDEMGKAEELIQEMERV